MVLNLSRFSWGKIRFKRFALCKENDISQLWIKWNISPVSQYLIAADFMRYYQDQYISKLQISWDTSPGSQYFTVADIMRYFTKILLSHSWRSNDIFCQDDIISSLFLCTFVLLSLGLEVGLNGSKRIFDLDKVLGFALADF